MEFGWFHDDEDGLAEINITPLVDVALVLLIIFMITAPMLIQGASVALPQTRPMSKLPSGNVFLTINVDGEVFMNEEEEALEIDALEVRLVPFIELGQAVFIQGDKDVPYGRIMAVIDAIKGAGGEAINLVSTPVPAEAR